MAIRSQHVAFSLASVLVFVASTDSTFAAFTAPIWSRPSSLVDAAATTSTYQAWNLFNDDDLVTTGIQDAAPDVTNINPNGSASLFEPGNGFITSGGNLYSPFAALQISITVPSYGSIANASTKFLVQIRTLGSELVLTNPADPAPIFDFSHVTIDGTPVSTLSDFSYAELSRTALGGMGGASVDHAFAFTLPAAAASHLFRYETLGSSSSQDQITIDTIVVTPEPASLGLIGSLYVASRRRR